MFREWGTVVVLDEGRVEGCGSGHEDSICVGGWGWSWNGHFAGRRRYRGLRVITKKGRKDDRIEERW